MSSDQTCGQIKKAALRKNATMALVILLTTPTSTQASGAQSNQIQVDRDLKRAVELANESQDSAVWASSGYLPSEIFQNARMLGRGAHLCLGLVKLIPSDLILFEPQIRLEKGNALLKCHEKLIEKIDGYWDRDRERFLKATQISLLEDEKKVLVQSALKPFSKLSPNQVALVIEIARLPSLNENLLQILEKSHLKALFVGVGSRLKDQRPLLRTMLQKGHSLGSMGWSGSNLMRQNINAAQRDIEKGMTDFTHLLNSLEYKYQYFAFPHGAHTKYLTRFLKRKGIHHIQSTVRAQGWKHRSSLDYYKDILRRATGKSGTILYLNGNETQLSITLPSLIEALRSNGKELVYFGPSRLAGDQAIPGFGFGA